MHFATLHASVSMMLGTLLAIVFCIPPNRRPPNSMRNTSRELAKNFQKTAKYITLTSKCFKTFGNFRNDASATNHKLKSQGAAVCAPHGAEGYVPIVSTTKCVLGDRELRTTIAQSIVVDVEQKNMFLGGRAKEHVLGGRTKLAGPLLLPRAR